MSLKYKGLDNNRDWARVRALGIAWGDMQQDVVDALDPNEADDLFDAWNDYHQALAQMCFDFGYSAGRRHAAGQSPEALKERNDAMRRRAAQSFDPDNDDYADQVWGS